MEPNTRIEESDISRSTGLLDSPASTAGQGREKAPTPISVPRLTLAKEAATFERFLPDLLLNHAERFVVICGEEVLSTFETRSAALAAGYEKYGIVPFLVRQILREEPDAYFTRDV